MLSSIACRTGAVRDFNATTTASASGTGSSGCGTPMSCTVRMPPRTSMEQRSVAPVKSSAIAPSSMASPSRWQDQYVAVTDGYGKPAAKRLPEARFLPLGDGIGMRRPSVARGIGGAVDQRALHAERDARIRQSLGADAVTPPRAMSMFGASVPSAGPKPLSRRMSRRKAVRTRASCGWRGCQASRPSAVRQARNGTVSMSHSRASHAADTRSSNALHTTASISSWPGLAWPSRACRRPVKRGGEGTARSRCSARNRHSPCGVDTDSSSPSAVAANPFRRAHAACGRPSSSSASSASIRIQS